MSKFIFHGDHDGEVVGIDLGILDLHGRPLVPPSLVGGHEDRKGMIRIEAGKSFLIDHTDPLLMHVDQWLRTDRRFQCLDRELLPKGTKAGAGNSR